MIDSIEKGQKILKKHYDLQKIAVAKTKNELDILWVNMKFTHSQDVFKMSEFLVENDIILKKLENKYKIYGKLGALLHDIGRCYEIGTEKLKGIPHGVFGAENILKQIEKEDNIFLLLSLKYHDDLFAIEKTQKEMEEIPNLSSKEKETVIILLKLVMDSDKLANFELFSRNDFNRKYFLSLALEKSITSSCLENFRKRELVPGKSRQTVFDQIISYLSWAYDLNFLASKTVLKNGNYLQNLINTMKNIERELPKENKDLLNNIQEIEMQLKADDLIK